MIVQASGFYAELSWVSKISASASRVSSPYVAQCLYVHRADDLLTLFATDGCRAHCAVLRVDTDGADDTCATILSSHAFSALKAFVHGAEGALDLSFATDTLSVRYGDQTLTVSSTPSDDYGLRRLLDFLKDGTEGKTVEKSSVSALRKRCLSALKSDKQAVLSLGANEKPEVSVNAQFLADALSPSARSTVTLAWNSTVPAKKPLSVTYDQRRAWIMPKQRR